MSECKQPKPPAMQLLTQCVQSKSHSRSMQVPAQLALADVLWDFCCAGSLHPRPNSRRFIHIEQIKQCDIRPLQLVCRLCIHKTSIVTTQANHQLTSLAMIICLYRCMAVTLFDARMPSGHRPLIVHCEQPVTISNDWSNGVCGWQGPWVPANRDKCTATTKRLAQVIGLCPLRTVSSSGIEWLCNVVSKQHNRRATETNIAHVQTKAGPSRSRERTTQCSNTMQTIRLRRAKQVCLQALVVHNLPCSVFTSSMYHTHAP